MRSLRGRRLPEYRRRDALHRRWDDRQVVGLAPDLPLVKPPNADGLVNWLTTHLINALQHSRRCGRALGSMSCPRPQSAGSTWPRSSVPVHARMSDGHKAFWVRMNNSTRSAARDRDRGLRARSLGLTPKAPSLNRQVFPTPVGVRLIASGPADVSGLCPSPLARTQRG